MTAIEQIKTFQMQGMPESEIISRLKTQGISPLEINDAFNQLKIKNAVEQKNYQEEMQPSIMQNQNYSPQEKNYPQQEYYSPQTNPPTQYIPQTQPEYYSQNQNYLPEEEYYEESSSNSITQDTDTIIEISEQVFNGKSKGIQKELKSLKEFKEIYSPKIQDIDERLKRIEKMFDKMQIAILEKVGDFGKNINKLQKEIEMVEDSITKLNKR